MYPIPIETRLFNVGQVRELEQRAIQETSFDTLDLMETAGARAFAVLKARSITKRPRLGIVCGVGNNAGDGYVVARHASLSGWQVAIWELDSDKKLPPNALEMRNQLPSNVLIIDELSSFYDCDWIVDALIGSGLSRTVTGSVAAAIGEINSTTCKVMSLDLPSGLDGDTGRVRGVAVHANLTICFVALKWGLVVGQGKEVSGEVVLERLGIPDSQYEQLSPVGVLISDHLRREALPPRRYDAHKGNFGHTLIIGGDIGLQGAARLAGEAAARVGSGLVSLGTRYANALAISSQRPELMAFPLESNADFKRLIKRCTVLAVGPGLGRSQWADWIMNSVIIIKKGVMIFDADALNWLSENPMKLSNSIVTPHPGEAARLLGCSTADVQANRAETARQISDRYDAVCVLKGACTVVTGPEELVWVCTAGNPGMAAGGMGDVLTGIIAGLAAQGLDMMKAATVGVWIHATSGDRAAAGGERGLLASDLVLSLKDVVNAG